MIDNTTKLTWTTQYGDELAPQDFDDRHLINTICFLERKHHFKNVEDLFDECAKHNMIYPFLVAEAVRRELIDNRWYVDKVRNLKPIDLNGVTTELDNARNFIRKNLGLDIFINGR